MNLHESTITANGIDLRIYRTGSGRPPLIFAHGLTDNGLCYWPIAARFAARYEIILYDSRNHGQSAAVDGRSTLRDRAADLAGLIETLGLHRPGLLGHSLGAITIALMAGLYPQLPGCIVLEDPPTLESMAAIHQQPTEMWRAWREMAAADRQKSFAELIAQNRQQHPDWPAAEREPWARAKQQLSMNAFDEGPPDVAAGNAALARISCPTLLLTADAERGAVFPVGQAPAFIGRLPDARHVHITGAGHNIRRERPEVFVTVVGDFLREWCPA